MDRPVRTLSVIALIGGAALVATGCRTTKAAAKQTGEVKPTGMLNVTCNADAPTITVDGKPAGVARQGPYKAGPHTVRAEADGYEGQTQTVTVQDSTATAVAFTLKRLPGAIQVSVNVEADCDIAGDHQKSTPAKPATFSEPAGLVQVICKAPGYREASTLVGVKGGHTVTQPINLSPNVRIEPMTGLEFVWLPGGSAHVGCATNDPGCPKPDHPDDNHPIDNGKSVEVRPMWLSRTEITEEAYRKCVEAGSCEIPKALKGAACNFKVAHRERYPMNCLTWEQAQEFCSWIGGRLPTANEWQYAARGGRDLIYPWGQQPVTKDRANYCDKGCHRKRAEADKGANPPPPPSNVHDEEGLGTPPERQSDGFATTAPVGSFPGGATPDGLLDMAGNVEEWTSTEVEGSTTDGDRKVSGVLKMVVGGSWSDEPLDMRISRIHPQEPKHRSDTLGARCLLR